jgi:hypothetical protein
MTLELIIRDEVVEKMPVHIDPAVHKTFHRRKQVIDDCANYLKTKYKRDLYLTNDWALMLDATSQMKEK